MASERHILTNPLHEVLFDGARQGQDNFRNARGRLFPYEEPPIAFKASLGIGSNNYTEIMVLHLLLKKSMDKGLRDCMYMGTT